MATFWAKSENIGQLLFHRLVTLLVTEIVISVCSDPGNHDLNFMPDDSFMFTDFVSCDKSGSAKKLKCPPGSLFYTGNLGKNTFVGCLQCDRIGQFLKVLGDKFSYKSSPNIWK